MHILELKRLRKRSEDLEIHVLNHPHSRYYVIEVHCDGEVLPLETPHGKPMVFRNLDTVYSTLSQAGICHAYLVRQPAKFELTGNSLPFDQAELLRTPLSF